MVTARWCAAALADRCGGNQLHRRFRPRVIARAGSRDAPARDDARGKSNWMEVEQAGWMALAKEVAGDGAEEEKMRTTAVG